MFRRIPLRAIGSGLVLAALLSLCGLVVLGENAQRDWSLHWNSPTVVLPSTSSFDYSAATTARGWDIAWTDLRGRLILSSFDSSGRRDRPDITLQGSPSTLTQSLTLGHAANFDVVAWRQDTADGSTLRTATVDGRSAPVYRTVAGGSAPIEHPIAFTDGNRVGVVFSWQRPQFNVFLSTVDRAGRASIPIALTRRRELRVYSTRRHGHFSELSSGVLRSVLLGFRVQRSHSPVQPLRSASGTVTVAGRGYSDRRRRHGIVPESLGHRPFTPGAYRVARVVG